MASRLLPLTLALLGFAGFAFAAACGGGGGDDPAPTGTPAGDSSAKPSPTTSRPGDSRSLQPASATATPASSATPTPSGPLGPEGAAPRITSRSRNAGSEVDNSSGSTEPVTIPFVAPLDDWNGFGDPFGADRGNGLVHGGIDFLLDSYPRASIYAACTGWVAAINTADTYGKHIVVKCDNSQWTTVYAHLGDTLVKLNDKVTAGKTAIARSGGPTPWGPEMLHFELRWDFVPVDPNVHIDLNVRPSRTIPATPTPTGTPTGTPEPGSTPGAPGSTPAAPTATPTKTPTPTPTLWYQPTPTPAAPTATPTRVPTSTPTPTATLPAPTPTPTQLPQTF